MPLSLLTIHLLGETPGPATLVVPGGQPRAAEGALTGPLTLTFLAALRFDAAVIGCCGLSAADGLTAYDLDDAAVKKRASPPLAAPSSPRTAAGSATSPTSTSAPPHSCTPSSPTSPYPPTR